jgi:hypothetical protein
LAQGICLQGTEIAARIDAESAENAVFAGIFLRFPVKFPVLREFEAIGQTVGSSMIVVDAIDERAAAFYAGHGFVRLPESMRLVLPTRLVAEMIEP